MGEGWSDVIAWAVTMKATDTRATDRPSGPWVTNNPKGVRQYPYSTDMTRNPHKYSDISKKAEVHYIGEIWSTMLYHVYWNMVEKSGFSEELIADSKTFGNQHFIQLIIDGLKLVSLFQILYITRYEGIFKFLATL
jgi:extracellular elastinolytic metalloproteinase